MTIYLVLAILVVSVLFSVVFNWIGRRV